MCKKSSSGSLSKSVIFSLIAGVGKIHLIFSSTHMVTNNKNEETFSAHMFAHRTPSSHSINMDHHNTMQMYCLTAMTHVRA